MQNDLFFLHRSGQITNISFYKCFLLCHQVIQMTFLSCIPITKDSHYLNETPK